MADHIWSVLCKDSVADAETNNVSLFNIVEQINLIATPEAIAERRLPDVINVSMVLLTLWTRSDADEPESANGRVILESPTGKVLYKRDYSIALKKTARHRYRLIFSGINFDGFGRYRFIVKKKIKGDRWSIVARVPLEVLQAEQGS